MIALDRYLRSQRRRLGLVVACCALAFSVLSAHSALSAGHMGMEGDHGNATVVAMCLAVAETAAVVLLATGWLRRAAPITLRLRRLIAWPSPASAPPLTRSVPARAGPAELQVFRL